MVQRDEFLNYYIKSQILAMALVKDRAKMTTMQAWSRLHLKTEQWKKLTLQRKIRDALNIKKNLEAR